MHAIISRNTKLAVTDAAMTTVSSDLLSVVIIVTFDAATGVSMATFSSTPTVEHEVGQWVHPVCSLYFLVLPLVCIHNTYRRILPQTLKN